MVRYPADGDGGAAAARMRVTVPSPPAIANCMSSSGIVARRDWATKLVSSCATIRCCQGAKRSTRYPLPVVGR